MDKNSIIGFSLIGLIFVGFTFYQSKEYKKQAAIQAKLDSVALAKSKADSAAFALNATTERAVSKPAAIYKDEYLTSASQEKEEIHILKNDKMEVAFTTKGAQPYSVRLNDYKNYDSTDTYIFYPGNSELGISVYAGEIINTKDFNFKTVRITDTSVVMQLPFSSGGYIEQQYSIRAGSYSVENKVSFIGMQDLISKNVSSVDIDYSVVMPRMEKGYQNEVRYSKLNYYVDGEKSPEEVGKGKDATKTISSSLSWFAFQQQFFSAIMRAPKNFSSGELAVKFFPEDNKDHNLMSCTAKMRTEIKGGQSDISIPFEFYFGPNRYKGLKSYGYKFEKIIPLGGWMVGWFTKYVIIPLFDFLHKFISNFGLIILLMTIFIKLVVLPFSYKSYASSAKMQALKPEIDKLSEKYPKEQDAMKKQQAMMDLYKRAGVNPIGGCLPMLLQFPILWAMFRFFPASIELRQQSFLWADDLSGYDSFINFGFSIPLLGDHISLFALLMALSMFFYSKMNSSQMASNDPNSQFMKTFSVWMMPIMMFFIGNNLSAGLSYYYLLSNLITMFETFIIKKFFIHPEDVLAKLKASEGKPIQKSKWQLRLEEAQRMQQQMARNKK